MSSARVLSERHSELLLEIVKLAETSFDSGEESPDADSSSEILREALRSAKDDLRLLAAAQRQLGDVEAAAAAFTRAECRIDLALALHEFRMAEREINARRSGGAS